MGEAQVEMKHSSFLDEPQWVALLEKELMYIHDPLTTDADRIQQIVDLKYSKANLNEVISEMKHLTSNEQSKLLKLVKKFEYLSDGTLGAWKTEPVELELKAKDCKPYYAKPYPVPHSQERKLKDEIQRMCDYGVIRK